MQSRTGSLECSTSAHTKKEPPYQVPVAPHLHHAAEPQPATNRKRRCQPHHHAADDANAQLIGLNLPQEHPSGPNGVFVNPPASPPAHHLPAMTVRSSRPKAATMACDGQPYASRVTRVVISSWGLCAR